MSISENELKYKKNEVDFDEKISQKNAQRQNTKLMSDTIDTNMKSINF